MVTKPLILVITLVIIDLDLGMTAKRPAPKLARVSIKYIVSFSVCIHIGNKVSTKYNNYP